MKMNNSNVKEKKQRRKNENDVSKFKKKYISIVMSVMSFVQSDYNIILRVRCNHRLKVDSYDTLCNINVLYKNKTEKILKKSIVDEDDYNIITLI